MSSTVTPLLSLRFGEKLELDWTPLTVQKMANIEAKSQNMASLNLLEVVDRTPVIRPCAMWNIPVF